MPAKPQKTGRTLSLADRQIFLEVFETQRNIKRDSAERAVRRLFNEQRTPKSEYERKLRDLYEKTDNYRYPNPVNPNPIFEIYDVIDPPLHETANNFLEALEEVDAMYDLHNAVFLAYEDYDPAKNKALSDKESPLIVTALYIEYIQVDQVRVRTEVKVYDPFDQGDEVVVSVEPGAYLLSGFGYKMIAYVWG